MFKRILVLLVAMLVSFNIAFAATANKTIISSTTLDDDPTSVTSTVVDVQTYKKVAFFVDYDETEVGNAVSATVTIDVSFDGTNFVNASFHDYAGGATLQTSEVISADGWAHLWLDPDANIVSVRMVITGNNTDSDDTATVIGYLIGVK